MADASESPLGFGPPRVRDEPRLNLPVPLPSRPASPRESPEPEAPPAARQAAREAIEDRTRTLRDRVSHLREMATGGRRPLASPEGDRHQPRGETKRSWASSEKAGVVDLLAIGIRQVTEWLDWGLAKRMPERDFVTTAREAYAIAAPAATFVLDHIPEGSALEGVVEHAGIAGAGVTAVGYATRALSGRPGGREESEALKERVAKRLAGGRRRVTEEAAATFADSAQQGAEAVEQAPAQPYAAMIGLDDDDPGLGGVGPA